MVQEIREVFATDSRTLISMYLKQDDETGVSTAVPLTGLTSGAIKFELWNAATGVETLAATATGVTFSADATGLANYQFATPMEIAAGYYYGYFVLTVNSKTDHFPKNTGELLVKVSTHAQSAEAAYAAALRAL